MRLYRAKKGLDCYFDDRAGLLSALDGFIDLLEERQLLDPHFCPESCFDQAQIRYDWTFPPLTDVSCLCPVHVKEHEHLEHLKDFSVLLFNERI